jgi:hypothetical protein
MPIIKKTGYELHPGGIFEARLISVEEAENINPDWAPQFQHIFETTGTSEFGGNLTITYYTSQTLSDRSKFGALVKALGVDLNQIQNGGDFDTDELLGRSCNLTVEHRDRDDGTKQAKVSSVSAKIPF